MEEKGRISRTFSDRQGNARRPSRALTEDLTAGRQSRAPMEEQPAGRQSRAPMGEQPAGR